MSYLWEDDPDMEALVEEWRRAALQLFLQFNERRNKRMKKFRKIQALLCENSMRFFNNLLRRSRENFRIANTHYVPRAKKLRLSSAHVLDTSECFFNRLFNHTTNIQDDDPYILFFGLDEASFNEIVDLISSGFLELVVYGRGNGTHHPRGRISAAGRPRKVTTKLALAITLTYLRSRGTELRFLQILSGLSQSSVDDYIHHTLIMLQAALKNFEPARITLPNVEERAQYSQMIQKKYDALIGCWGSLDGCKLRCERPPGTEDNETYFCGWLGYHCLNNLFLFVPDGTIAYAVLNHPGSHSDQLVYNSSLDLLKFFQDMSQDNHRDDLDAEFHHIIVDAGFSDSTDRVNPNNCPGIHPLSTGRVRRRPKENEVMDYGQSIVQENFETLYFDQLKSARQLVEWGNGALQSLFPRLANVMPWRDIETKLSNRRLEVCCRLFNFRTRRMGRNQINTVFNHFEDRNLDQYIHNNGYDA